MKTIKTRAVAMAILSATFLLSGCSTLSSAYDSTASTISGWFGKEEKKVD